MAAAQVPCPRLPRAIAAACTLAGVALLPGCRVSAAGVPGQPGMQSAQPAASAPSFFCMVDGVGGATTAVQLTVTATNNTGTTITIMSVPVVFYGSSGQELASNPDVSFWETIPAGQSVMAHVSSDGVAGITGCGVAGYG